MIQYRYDIDGLRALAVIGVLVFHLGFDIFPGGFAGVDVFFVISGYLITLIILSDLRGNRFRLLHFYVKRIKRLLPALFAVMLTVLIVSYWLFMPDQFVDVGQSVVSVSVYLSNFYFFLKMDYFSGPAELIPLLHTWSLAVEEQFYIVYPLVIMLAYKINTKALITTLAVLFLLSFIANIMFIQSMPSAVFYLPIFRFWELLAGGLVAMVLLSSIQLSEKLGIWLCGFGLLLILMSFLLLTKQTMFPGWAALLPVIGTSCVLLSVPKRVSNINVFQQLLSSLPMRFVGNISYSLYLWHWPLIVFYGYWVIRDLYLYEKLLLLLVSVAISYLSFRYIEQVFRQKKVVKKKWILTNSALISGVFVSIGMVIYMSEGLPQRFAHIPQAKNNEANACFLRTNQDYREWQFNNCVLKQNDRPQYTLLWGDSHANHLISGLKLHAKQRDENYIMYSSAGCVPIFDLDLAKRPNCQKNNQYVRELLKNHNINKVIIAGNWDYSINENHFDISLLANTIRELSALNIDLTVVSQIPIHAVKAPNYLAYRLSQQTPEILEYRLKPVSDIRLHKEIKALSGEAKVFNPMDVLCIQNDCLVYLQGHLLMEDNAHLSPKGSHFLMQSFMEFY